MLDRPADDRNIVTPGDIYSNANTSPGDRVTVQVRSNAVDANDQAVASAQQIFVELEIVHDGGAARGRSGNGRGAELDDQAT